MGPAAAGVGARAAFGAACFLAAATAGEGVGFGDGVLAAVGAGWAREADAVGGSAVMMLTGGVDEALGNSALVGLPVGMPGISAATGAGAADTGGAFHTGK